MVLVLVQVVLDYLVLVLLVELVLLLQQAVLI